MKKIIGLIVFIFVCFSFFNSSVVFAKTQMLVNREGDTRQVEVSSNVWRNLTQAKKRAVENPGKEIVFGKPEIEVERNLLKDFFHLTTVRTYNKVIVFNSNNNKFYYLNKKVTKRGRKQFAWYVLFILIGVFSMAYINIKHKTKRGNTDIDTATVIIFGFAFGAPLFVSWLMSSTILTLPVIIGSIINISTALSALVATFIAFYLEDKKSISWKIFIRYYLLMGIALLF